MKKANGISVIIFALCAIIWSIRAVIDLADIVNVTSIHSTAWVVGDVLCAVVWIAAFGVQLIRYCSHYN